MAAFDLIYDNGDTILRNKYGIYSKKELEEQIVTGRLTIRELGELYSLKEYQIAHVLRILKINIRNVLSHTRVSDPHIDSSLHQVILGTLLGDAYMTHPKKYGLGHGVYQMGYFFHVAERLHPFVASVGDKKTGGSTEKSFELWTHRHEVFEKYYERFYSKGLRKKYFTESTAPDLNAEGLAYWYMDDGKWSPSGAHLCVGSISEDEIEVLVHLLKDSFDIDSNPQIHDKRKGYVTIYIPSKSRDHFFELINPHVIGCMSYKLNGSVFPRGDGFNAGDVAINHRKLCDVAGRFIRYFGDESVINKLEPENYEDDKALFLSNKRKDIREGRQISKTLFRRTPTEKDLRAMLDKGMSDQAIGEKLGYGRNAVASMRRSLGIDRKNSRSSQERMAKLPVLFSQPGMTIKEAMKRSRLSYYKVKEWLKEQEGKAHQRVIKEKRLKSDLETIDFDPSEANLSEYVFSHEDMTTELKKFLREYEWLGTEGTSAKWCFTMRLRGHLAGLQVLNEPTSYSKMLGDDTAKMECLIQRGCTVSWAHEHLGSKMLSSSIKWMVNNTDKRLFIGYADPLAGEVGVIYQACNFLYLGNRFGVKNKYRHPTYKKGKEFCEHSLRRTSVFLSWCKKNGVEVQDGWIKPNGFKDLRYIPVEIKKRWYEWGNSIIRESDKVEVLPKGKYAFILGRDRRETKILRSLFNAKTFPYPKR